MLKKKKQKRIHLSLPPGPSGLSIFISFIRRVPSTRTPIFIFLNANRPHGIPLSISAGRSSSPRHSRPFTGRASTTCHLCRDTCPGAWSPPLGQSSTRAGALSVHRAVSPTPGTEQRGLNKYLSPHRLKLMNACTCA